MFEGIIVHAKLSKWQQSQQTGEIRKLVCVVLFEVRLVKNVYFNSNEITKNVEKEV